MGKIFDKELISRQKNKIIITAIILIVVIFVVFNNVAMLTPNFIWSKTYREPIVESFFSISFIRFTILYIFYAIVATVFFKDKKLELQKVEEGEYTKGQWFFSKMLCVYISFLIPLVINTIIKLMLYNMSYKFYHEKLAIGISVILIFFVFQALLAFCSLQTFILAHLFFGDLFKATIFPVLFVEFIFTTFGINSLFISSKLDFINSIIAPIKYTIVDNLIDIIFWNGRLELQDKSLKILLLTLTLLIGIIFMIINYLMLNKLNIEKVELTYTSKYTRIIYHIILAVMCGFYIPAAIFYYISIMQPNVSIDSATYTFNIIALISIPIIFLFILEKPIWNIIRDKMEKTS